jgi:hypothetical protein
MSRAPTYRPGADLNRRISWYREGAFWERPEPRRYDRRPMGALMQVDQTESDILLVENFS